MTRAICAFALTLVLGFAALGPARAQTQFDDAKLASFVSAAMAVSQLIEQWNPRIQSAQNEEEANALRQQAQTELVDAINRTEGMSVEEYQQIGEAARADPQLAERINTIYKDRTGQQ
ncbi:MAG: DUF4168 domain-containing protein [Geminicoccaceae bacterium]